MATPRGDADNSLEAARAAAVVAAAAPMPAPPAQRRRSVEPCLAEVIDGLKLKPAQAESLEQLLDEHEVHDLATAHWLAQVRLFESSQIPLESPPERLRSGRRA